MGLGYLLDSDVVIAALKKKEKIADLELLGRRAEPVSISVISLFEVWDGIFGSTKISVEKGRLGLEIFLKEFVAGVLLVDEKISIKAGEIRAQLRASGELIGNLDILIAATCIVNGLTLVTKNKRHFGRI